MYDSSGIRGSRDECDCGEVAAFLRAFRGGQGVGFSVLFVRVVGEKPFKADMGWTVRFP